MDGGGHEGEGNGSHPVRGHMRVPSNTQSRGYVHSARGDSDILSSGDDGPTWPRPAGSDRSRTTTTEGRQSSRTSNPNTASTSRKSKRLSFGRKPRAEVSWADSKKSMEADKYTFFRDPTPPPPEEREKGFGAGVVVPTGSYDYRYDHVAPPAPLPSKERKCGMRRRTFWIVLAAVLVAIVVAVGVGVGVGVGSSGGDSSSASEDKDSSGSNDTTESDTATSSSIPSSTSTSPPRTTTTSRSSCPAANNTVYSVPGSDKSFLRICGVDYSGEFGGDRRAQDIGVVITKNMEDCIVNCAGYPGCTGCGWGIIQGDESDEHRCWLKARLGESHVARPGWDFAILQ
ncbi:hypothetical protein LIA77_06632 [Sarocladium implicatum]|nr:hypothetical protein LIA77_06632 [Sarocladium implicatum]